MQQLLGWINTLLDVDVDDKYEFDSDGLRGKLDYETYACEWNQSANGKDQFYITSEVLSAYAKNWKKVNNICASQEMIQNKIDLVHQNCDIFAVNHLPFPNFLTGTTSSVQPCQGVIDVDPGQLGPASTPVELSVSDNPSLHRFKHCSVCALTNTWNSKVNSFGPYYTHQM